MHTANFDEGIDQITAKDSRYHKEAYHFVREALDYTQGMLKKGGKAESRPAATGEEVPEGGVRHVSGQQLLEGIRAYALEQFGPMTFAVLAEWGVHRCEDFGEIVFNLIDIGQMKKTASDRREDFDNVFNFDDGLHDAFLPITSDS